MPANKKLAHAERAKCYADKCANKKIEASPQVSKAYAKWLDYEGKHELKAGQLAIACQLIENACGRPDGDLLKEECCAFLSWPLFAAPEEERAIKEVHVLSKIIKDKDITKMMAGLMLSEIASPFRSNSREKMLNYKPTIVAAGSSMEQAESFLAEAREILNCNPEFGKKYGIANAGAKIVSTKLNCVIEPRSIKSRQLGSRGAIAIFIDDFNVGRDARYMTGARTNMRSEAGHNSLLVTNGVWGSIRPQPLGSVRDEKERRSREDQPMDGRIDLLYLNDTHA